MRTPHLALRRALQTALRWGLYGLVAGLVLTEMARMVLGEWLDDHPGPSLDDSPVGPPPVRPST